MTLPPPIRNFLRSSKLIRHIFYNWHFADIPVRLGQGNFKKEATDAMCRFLNKQEFEDKAISNEIYRDICRCFYRYKTSPLEYFLFNFRNKKHTERESYISDRFVMKYAADKSGRKIHDDELNDKYRFFQINEEYFCRKAMLFDSSTTPQQFYDFSISVSRLIAKPNASALGSGVRIFNVGNDAEISDAFNQLKKTDVSYILEEVINQHQSMAVWNDSCVNTVRVNSFLNNGKFSVLCPFIRTGRRGSIVDNGGQGGVFASIDKESGKICTDGMDENLNVYTGHPDSGIRYKGWQVPEWRELMALTEKCHKNMPKHSYISWDFAMTENGWVLIEGNWGEFVAQQITNKRGFRKEFIEHLNS